MSWSFDDLERFVSEGRGEFSSSTIQVLMYPSVRHVKLTADEKLLLEQSLGCMCTNDGLAHPNGDSKYHITLPENIPGVDVDDIPDPGDENPMKTVQDVRAWFAYNDHVIRHAIVNKIKTRRQFHANLLPYEQRALKLVGYQVVRAPCGFDVIPPQNSTAIK